MVDATDVCAMLTEIPPAGSEIGVLWRTNDAIVRKATVVQVHSGGKSPTAQIVLDRGEAGPKVDICHMVEPLYARSFDDDDDGPSTWFDDDEIAAERVRGIPLGSNVLAFKPTKSKKLSNWFKGTLSSIEDPILPYVDVDAIAAGTPWHHASRFPVNSRLNDIVRVWQGDITHLCVDAIQNAANSGLKSGGGICGAIHGAAGDELEAACFEYPERQTKSDYVGGVSPKAGAFAPLRCDEGDTRLTPGFKLHANAVLHTVGPKGVRPELLRSAYRSALDQAVAHNLRSVALCAISTGEWELRSSIFACAVTSHPPPPPPPPLVVAPHQQASLDTMRNWQRPSPWRRCASGSRKKTTQTASTPSSSASSPMMTWSCTQRTCPSSSRTKNGRSGTIPRCPSR